MNALRSKSVGKAQNIFEEIGVRDPHVMLLKADLAYRINEQITRRRLTQVEAAKLLRVQQPSVSDIARGNLRGYSLERLMGYLRILDPGFRISVEPGAVPSATTRRKGASRRPSAPSL